MAITGRGLFRPGDITSGLQGYWKMDEAAGATRADSSGNGFDLTDVGGDCAAVAEDYWSTGENSADFEATTLANYMTGGDNLDMNSSDVSMCAWIKAETTIANVYIAYKGTGATDGYGMRTDASGNLQFYAGGTVSTATTAMVVGKWYHIAAVFDDTANLVSLYLDGNITNVLSNTGTIADVATVFTVGSEASSPPSGNYDGLLKDLAVWNVKLTPLQIKSLAFGQDLSKFTYRPDKISTNLKLYAKLNEAVVSGNRTDTQGTHTITDVGSVPALEGYIEGAGADFDGTADYFTIADHADFDFSGGVFTVAAWIKTDVAGNSVVFGQQTDNNNYIRCGIDASPAGKLNIEVTAAGSVVVDVVGATTLIVDTWYHVAFVEDGDTWKVYLDGVDDTNTGGTDTQRSVNYTGTASIGSRGAGAIPFNGQIADVAIWNGTALSAAQIASLASGLDINDQALVAYWKMNDASGNATDYSGNANTLTENGTIASAAGQVGNGRLLVRASVDSFSIAGGSAGDLGSSAYFTAGLWYKPVSVTAVAHGLISVLSGANGGWEVTVANASTAEQGLGYGNDRINHGTAMTVDTFGYLVGRYDSATAAAFVNGVKASETAAGNKDVINDTDDFVVGGETEGASPADNTADGVLNEVFHFKRALFDEEIKALYIKGLNAKEVTSSEIASTTGNFFLLL